MIRRLLFICILALLISLSSSVFAQDVEWPSFSPPSSLGTANADDVAVIVAVEDYPFLPNVPGARQNAADWQDFFRQGLGMENIYLLTDQDVTHEEIVRMASRAAEEVPKGANLWFIFIGHGAPATSGDDGVLVAMDARQTMDGLQSRSVAQRDLLAILERGRQASTIAVIDACFSGRDITGESLVPGLQPVLPVALTPSLASSTLVLTAAASDQFAGPLPGLERPAFSYLLLGALRGWASDEGDTISANQALQYTRRHLLRIPGRQQTPQIQGPADLILTRGAAEPDPTRRRPRPTPSAPTPTPAARPKLQKIADDRSALEYMRGICGDAATLDEYLRPICKSCPQDGYGSTWEPGEWQQLALNGGYVGDFAGDGRAYALLETDSCGWGHRDDRSTSLLRRSADGWVMIDYMNHIPLGECTPFRAGDKDRLFCSNWVVGGGYAHQHLRLLSVSPEGKILREELPDWDLPPSSLRASDEGLRNFEGAGHLLGYFNVGISTQFIGDLNDNGEPEIALGIVTKQGTPRPGHDPEPGFDSEDDYIIREGHLLRIWTLTPEGFQRAKELERSTTHPYLRRYQQ